MDTSVVIVNTKTLSDALTYDGVTLLTYKIEYPSFASSYYQLTLVKLNKYYETKAMEYQKHCETELFNMAIEQYKGAVANDFPVRVFEALAVYTVTYNRACIISLYFDKYEFTGGAHGGTLRYSQTWNLQTGGQVGLSRLITCPAGYKPYILQQEREETLKNPAVYFPDCEKLLIQTFNENSFYCTPKGIVIYYQQYDIAPYSSGIREFLILYSDCVLNPASLCFTA